MEVLPEVEYRVKPSLPDRKQYILRASLWHETNPGKSEDGRVDLGGRRIIKKCGSLRYSLF